MALTNNLPIDLLAILKKLFPLVIAAGISMLFGGLVLEVTKMCGGGRLAQMFFTLPTMAVIAYFIIRYSNLFGATK